MTERRNPSVEGTWTDGAGRVWHRRGGRGERLPERRVRTLLRRDDVPLVVWVAFETVRHEDPTAKQAAAEALHVTASDPDDVVAHEWRTDDGAVLLMLEHHC